MKKNLQEAEYKEIKGLDIKGQLLENAGTPEDRGDGKPFLMHKLRVMIGPYQKDIPITNQELRKIMFIQENKKMTLKERIKKELINMLQEEAAVNFDRGTMFDSMDEVIATLGGMAELHGTRQPRVAEKLASIVSQLQELKGQLQEGKSITFGMPQLQGTAKEIDDLIGAAIDAHMKADRFRQLGSKDFAAHMDQAVPKALAAVEQLLPKMNRIAIEKTMPHLAKALSASGEERLAALGKAKDALVPR